MALREEINTLIVEGKYDELVATVLRDKGALKYIISYLYHPFGLARWRAIEGLGWVSRALLETEPQTVRELIRRLLWSMNDESGTASWSAPEATAEIICQDPERFKEFVSILVYASEEEIFHRGIAWALGRIGGLRPDLVQDFMPLLIDFTRHHQPEVRGYAAWALGQIGSPMGLADLTQLQHDQAQAEVYQGQRIIIKSIGELARSAIEKINHQLP